MTMGAMLPAAAEAGEREKRRRILRQVLRRTASVRPYPRRPRRSPRPLLLADPDSQILMTRLEAITARLDGLAGDAAFGRALTDSDGLLTATQIAKEYGLSAMAFNALLARQGIQFKKNGQWLLYARYAGEGYTRTTYTTIVHRTGQRSIVPITKWTPQGRRFLYDFLKGRGMEPGRAVTREGMAAPAEGGGGGGLAAAV